MTGGDLEVLVQKVVGGFALISEERLSPDPLWLEALTLAESVGRVRGSVQKFPLGPARSAYADYPVIFAIEVKDELSPTPHRLRWVALTEAMRNMSPTIKAKLALLPKRRKSLTNRTTNRYAARVRG